MTRSHFFHVLANKILEVSKDERINIHKYDLQHVSMLISSHTGMNMNVFCFHFLETSLSYRYVIAAVHGLLYVAWKVEKMITSSESFINERCQLKIEPLVLHN